MPSSHVAMACKMLAHLMVSFVKQLVYCRYLWWEIQDGQFCLLSIFSTLIKLIEMHLCPNAFMKYIGKLIYRTLFFISCRAPWSTLQPFRFQSPLLCNIAFFICLRPPLTIINMIIIKYWSRFCSQISSVLSFNYSISLYMCHCSKCPCDLWMVEVIVKPIAQYLLW